MAYFTWKESFSVNVEQMDKQHQAFFGYLNQLHDALQSGEGEKVIDGILMALTDYVQTHFADEENMLRLADYPDLSAHLKQHAYFVAELDSLRTNLNSQPRAALNTFQLLRDWFINHILTEDKKYGDYLARTGNTSLPAH